MHVPKRNLAIFFAASFIPASILAGLASSGLVKLVNPDDIDVTQGLAYLGYGVIASIVTLVLFVGAALWLSLALRRREGNFSSAGLPLAVLAANLLLGAGILLFNEVNGIAEDNWSRANGQPTRQERSDQLDRFFESLEDQPSD